MTKNQKLILYILLTWLIALFLTTAVFGISLFAGLQANITVAFYLILALTILFTVVFIAKLQKNKIKNLAAVAELVNAHVYF